MMRLGPFTLEALRTVNKLTFSHFLFKRIFLSDSRVWLLLLLDASLRFKFNFFADGRFASRGPVKAVLLLTEKTAKLSAVWTNLFQCISQFVRLNRLLYTWQSLMWVKVNKVFLHERFQVEENPNIVWAEWVILHKWRHKATVWYSW